MGSRSDSQLKRLGPRRERLSRRSWQAISSPVALVVCLLATSVSCKRAFVTSTASLGAQTPPDAAIRMRA